MKIYHKQSESLTYKNNPYFILNVINAKVTLSVCLLPLHPKTTVPFWMNFGMEIVFFSENHPVRACFPKKVKV